MVGVTNCRMIMVKEYHKLPNLYGSQVWVAMGAGAGWDFPTGQKPPSRRGVYRMSQHVDINLPTCFLLVSAWLSLNLLSSSIPHQL